MSVRDGILKPVARLSQSSARIKKINEIDLMMTRTDTVKIDLA
jgi:hypothetical protein